MSYNASFVYFIITIVVELVSEYVAILCDWPQIEAKVEREPQQGKAPPYKSKIGLIILIMIIIPMYYLPV